jgi:hypothetical protein
MCIQQEKRKLMIQKRVYEELKQIVDHFHKYHIKIILGDFNVKVGKENNSKPKIENDRLHQGNKDNGVRIVNIAI